MTCKQSFNGNLFIDSVARLTDKHAPDDDDVPVEDKFSSIRKRAALIDDGDKRYHGQTVSRKDQDSDSGRSML